MALPMHVRKNVIKKGFRFLVLFKSWNCERLVEESVACIDMLTYRHALLTLVEGLNTV